MKQQRVLAWAAVLGCIVLGLLAGVLAWRVAPGAMAPKQADLVDELWGTVSSGANVLGSPTAPNTIVVFTDYECHTCRDYDEVLRDLLVTHAGRVRVVVRHRPLRVVHPRAEAAALAAECGAAVGAFEAVHYLLFDSLDSLGKISWRDLGMQAGLNDPELFDHCVATRKLHLNIAADLALAERLRLRLLPAVFVNGRALGALPSKEMLIGSLQD